MTPSPKQIARLPKWARQYIEQLERDQNDFLAETMLTWQAEPSSFCARRLHLKSNIPGEYIYFPLARYDVILIGGVEVRLQDDQCEARVGGGPEEMIAAIPQASNSIFIRGVRR
jgi:hypothetical protein